MSHILMRRLAVSIGFVILFLMLLQLMEIVVVASILFIVLFSALGVIMPALIWAEVRKHGKDKDDRV